jgi:hypothetical protein
VPRKTSIRLAAQEFAARADAVVDFATRLAQGATGTDATWLHDYAIIRVYREFEALVLQALVGSLNNDTSTISSVLGIKFPKHLTDEVCEFLVTGGGYFDFKGRDGLIKILKGYVPDTHYLVVAVSRQAARPHIERLCALRNYAAHGSDSARNAAIKAIGGNRKRLASAGAWLKVGGRLAALVAGLKTVAAELRAQAPY